MKCPHCTNTTLVMSDRQGVEIDYCPSCRGIWLDRGELDKLLDKAAATSVPTSSHASQATRPPQRPDFVDSDYRDAQRPQRGYRKSWLSDIFD